jgi:hypothetical protein
VLSKAAILPAMAVSSLSIGFGLGNRRMECRLLLFEPTMSANRLIFSIMCKIREDVAHTLKQDPSNAQPSLGGTAAGVTSP